MNNNNNNAADEMLFGEWMDLDTNETTTTTTNLTTATTAATTPNNNSNNNNNHYDGDFVRSRRSQDESKVVVMKRHAVDPPAAALSAAATTTTTGKCLSSSFDFSLLGSSSSRGGGSSSSSNNHRHDDGRQQQQLFTPTLLRYASSWDDGDIPHRRGMDSCKRTKLLTGVESSSSSPYLLSSSFLHTTHLNSSSNNNNSSSSSNSTASHHNNAQQQDNTVRKARRSMTDSPQQAAFRQPSSSLRSVKKGNKKLLTPASAKRHRASLHHIRSPMRRVPPLTPRASALSSNSNSNSNLGNTSTAAAAAAAPTTTTTSAAATTTTANFSSIKQPRRPKVSLGTTATAASTTLLETTTDTLDSRSSADTLESNTPFRFTSFPASLPRIQAPAADEDDDDAEDNVDDEDDEGNNTSGGGGGGGGPPPPTTVRKRMTFGSSSAHDEQQHRSRAYVRTTAAAGGRGAAGANDDDTHHTSVSSLHHDFDDDDDGDGNYAYSDDDDDDRDPILSPRTRLDFQQMQSPVATTAAIAATSNACLDRYSPRLFDEPSTLHDHHHHLHHDDSKSLSPRCNNATMDLELQLDSAQCSPIPGIPEEPAASPSGDGSGGRRGGGGGGGRPNTSASSTSTCRPLPDLNAFDDDDDDDDINDQNGSSNSNNRSSIAADRSMDESGISSGRLSHPSPPKLLCPPTPERTPAWAHQVDHHHQQQQQQHEHFCLFSSPKQHHHRRQRPPPRRANSLIVTKVLATCELPLLDGSSFEQEQAHQQQQQAQAPPGANFASTEVGRTPLAVTAPRTTTTTRRKQHHHHHRDHALFQDPFDDDDDVTCKQDKAAIGDDYGEDDDDNDMKCDDAPSISINFEPISLLGSGTFADVYKVQSKHDGKLYALKKSRKMFRGQRDRERALLEVRCMQRLQHGKQRSSSSSNNNDNDTPPRSDSTYLLFFFQAWQQDGHFFCLTELCCRSTCRDLIDDFRSQLIVPARRKLLPSIQSLPLPMLGSSSGGGVGGGGSIRFLPNETIWKICHDVAAGLRHIHSHGLVHNDIKSSNIFMVLDHHFGPLCKIGDFGLTREAGFDDEEGDQKYMPSEVLDSGRKEASADIFSFGLMLYELAANLTFELPADGPRWHELRRRGHTLDVPACRSSQLKGIILSMIESDPGKRPTSSQLLDVKVIASSLYDKGFLQAYIADIEQLDRLEEERIAASRSCADQTPRTVPTARTRSCSPSIGNLPAAPLIYSPEAALS